MTLADFTSPGLRACLKTTSGAVVEQKAGWRDATKENIPGGSSTEEQRSQTAISFRPKLLDTLKKYSGQDFRADLIAGITVGIVALPLAMAFAIASGVPPQAGIFTAVIAGFIISALGGTKVSIGSKFGGIPQGLPPVESKDPLEVERASLLEARNELAGALERANKALNAKNGSSKETSKRI